VAAPDRATRLKVVHVIFESRFDAEIMGVLHREIEVPRYVRLDNMTGVREVEREGRRAYRSDDLHSLITIVCADDMAARILTGIAAVRGRLGHGVHAYSVSVEQFV
jgi:hypothetical protein